MSKARGSLPKLALVLVNQYDAWIVGGAADPEQTSPRDYDVVVPFYHWPSVAHLLGGYSATLNSLGGWKCVSDNCEVDVWPGDLGWVMCHQAAKWAWQPRYGIRLRKEHKVV